MPGSKDPERMVIAAERIARQAHAGQLYGDRDYFEGHIQPVVNIVEGMGYGSLFQATAYLHDVGEDAGYDTAWFEQNEPEIPSSVTWALELLNKNNSLGPHHNYLRRVIRSDLSIVGKFGDSIHNLASTALQSPDLDEMKFRERIAEYSGNIAFLRPLLPPPDLAQTIYMPH